MERSLSPTKRWKYYTPFRINLQCLHCERALSPALSAISKCNYYYYHSTSEVSTDELLCLYAPFLLLLNCREIRLQYFALVATYVLVIITYHSSYLKYARLFRYWCSSDAGTVWSLLLSYWCVPFLFSPPRVVKVKVLEHNRWREEVLDVLSPSFLVSRPKFRQQVRAFWSCLVRKTVL